MFGKQAIRLLREAWGGFLDPDAEGRLREKGAKQLSEELYAMFDDDIPLEHDGPITIRKGSNAPALTITNNAGGDSVVIQGDTVLGDGRTTGDFAVGGDFRVNVDSLCEEFPELCEPSDPDDPDAPDCQPCEAGFTVIGDTIRFFGQRGGGECGACVANFEVPIEVPDPANPGQTIPLSDFVQYFIDNSSTPTSSVFLGKVLSGSGDTYQVELYGNGSAREATATVEATVPQIAEGEAIPVGTWLAAVHKFVDNREPNDVITTYEFQVPIWMAES